VKFLSGSTIGDSSRRTQLREKRMVGKPEKKRPLGRPGRGWVNSIKIVLIEIGWDGVDWIYMAQDRDHWGALVNIELNLRVP
jgi:hypothetical protein